MSYPPLPDEIVHDPNGATVALLAAHGDVTRHLLIRTRRRIQIEREDRQATPGERQLHIALEIIQVRDVLLGDTVQFMQQACVLAGHVEGEKVIDICSTVARSVRSSRSR